MHDGAEITGNNAELLVSVPGVSDGESDASFKTGLAARWCRRDSWEATESQISFPFPSLPSPL